MKKEKQTLLRMAVVLVMAFTALAIIQCTPAQIDMPGSWDISLLEVYDDGGQELMYMEDFGSMEFNEDGSGVFFDGRAFDWGLRGNELSIVLDDTETVYAVTLIDDNVYTMEITANNMTTVMTITRQ